MSEQTTMLSLLLFDTTETGSSKELGLGLFQNMVFNFRVSLSPAIRGDQDKNGKYKAKTESLGFYLHNVSVNAQCNEGLCLEMPS